MIVDSKHMPHDVISNYLIDLTIYITNFNEWRKQNNFRAVHKDFVRFCLTFSSCRLDGTKNGSSYKRVRSVKRNVTDS